MAEAKIALHVLTAGLVLDRSVFVGQTVSEMQDTITAIRGAPKKVVTVIENGATFFTSANMLDLIKADNDAYKLIAEKAKVILRDDDVAAIKTAEAAKKAIEASMIPPIPPYPFAAVPDGFDIRKKFEICNAGKSLRRVGGYHQLSLLQARVIFQYMSEAWVNNRIVNSKYIRGHLVHNQAGGGYGIGCQEATRTEIEQIALWQGWEFPTKK
jgi:hypothetical protein